MGCNLKTPLQIIWEHFPLDPSWPKSHYQNIQSHLWYRIGNQRPWSCYGKISQCPGQNIWLYSISPVILNWQSTTLVMLWQSPLLQRNWPSSPSHSPSRLQFLWIIMIIVEVVPTFLGIMIFQIWTYQCVFFENLSFFKKKFCFLLWGISKKSFIVFGFF